MTKTAATLWFLALMGAALFISAILEAASGAKVSDGENISEMILGAGSLFAWSGLIPLIWWAIRRFQPKYAVPPFLMWTATLVLVGFLSLLGITITPGSA